MPTYYKRGCKITLTGLLNTTVERASAVNIDTLAIFQRLKKKTSLSEDAAQEIAEVFKDTMESNLMPQLPTIFPNPHSPIWWYSWYQPEGRIQHPHPLGLRRAVVSEEEALAALLRFFGLAEEKEAVRDLHSLRHTWTTFAVESGVDLWRIQQHLDHATIRTTEGYSHPDASSGGPIQILKTPVQK